MGGEYVLYEVGISQWIILVLVLGGRGLYNPLEGNIYIYNWYISGILLPIG